jgi:hypothetical protein
VKRLLAAARPPRVRLASFLVGVQTVLLLILNPSNKKILTPDTNTHARRPQTSTVRVSSCRLQMPVSFITHTPSEGPSKQPPIAKRELKQNSNRIFESDNLRQAQPATPPSPPRRYKPPDLHMLPS